MIETIKDFIIPSMLYYYYRPGGNNHKSKTGIFSFFSVVKLSGPLKKTLFSIRCLKAGFKDKPRIRFSVGRREY